MKRYKQISEKRRNPDLNPFIGAWDRLEELKDDPDVYISFTNVDKIGINPMSKFNTPVGIYTYPLREFITKYVSNARMSLQFDDKKINSVGYYAPYAGGGTYVNFIRLKDKSNFIEDMYTDYGSNDFDKDMEILKKKYDKVNPHIEKFTKDLDKELSKRVKKEPSITESDMIFIIGRVDKNVKVPTKILPRLTELLTQLYNSQGKNANFYNAITQILEVDRNWFDQIVNKGIETAKDKNPINSMWNVTRLLAQELSKSGKQASTKWNLILSKDLGYSGFADKSSRGIIHNAEPMQAVFLRANAFELLYRELNKPAKKTSEKIEFSTGTIFQSKIGSTIKIIGLSSKRKQQITYDAEVFNVDSGETWYSDFSQDLLKNSLKSGDMKIIKESTEYKRRFK